MKTRILIIAITVISLFNIGCSKTIHQVDSTLANESPQLKSAALMTSSKRGISYHSGPVQAGINNMAKANWYYNWAISKGATGVDPTLPSGSTYVPMTWGLWSVNATDLATAKTYGNTLLTFNEPDGSGQANLTVTEALSYWPTLQNTGMRLSSPAVAGSLGWLDNFMKTAASSGYRVDFVAYHKYPQTTDPIAGSNLTIQELKNCYANYGKPIWLTETALTYDNLSSVAQELAYMQNLLPQLENLSFVEKYCWYPLIWAGDGEVANSNLVDVNGNMTVLGKWYSAYSPNFESGKTYRLECHMGAVSLDNYGVLTNGAPIKQWGTSDSDNQLWVVTSLGNGYYKLVNKASGKALDNGNTNNEGAGVIQWDDDAANKYQQQWSITKNSWGWWRIQNRLSGKFLDNNNATTNGVQVVQKSAYGSWSQDWNFMIPL